MSNTVLTSKNTFQDGLVMDFSPDNTSSSILTSALNATLLTFNGNEMALQNDMGNGRVETAYLPEGYIPMGTCEFGDIIYIVSYNPITNKSQIGCFPSPERNISSDEISDVKQIVSSADFQIYNQGNITGQLKATSVKKVLFDSKQLNPGDKFIIYSNNLQNSKEKITDYGNTSQKYNTWPKLVKIHVVAIDDSGKMSYLDQDLKWYEDISYFIPDLQEQNNVPDIDSYRSLVSSAYSIFQSKNSGKLAILVELEQIDGFNCTYSTVSKNIQQSYSDIATQDYNIYLHISWSTSNNDINPCGLAILESEWVGENGGRYRIPKLTNGKYIYEEYSEVSQLPIKSSNPYDVAIELNRIYYPESSTTYESYIGEDSIPVQERIAPYDNNSDNHTKSYNYYITSDHLNYNVGWPHDVNNELRDVTRITQVKSEDGDYIKDTYYLNLDALQYEVQQGEKVLVPYTRGVSNILYKSGLYDNTKKGDVEGSGKVIISPDVVNNYFKKDVTVKLTSYSIPVFKDINSSPIPIDLNNMIWRVKVAPCMPYGVLEQYAQELIIDFSKIGKNTIELNNWRYYNQGEVCTLTYGINANLSNDISIKDVTLEFYDNQGLVATYVNSGKTSYSGVFTEQIGFNGNNVNYKLTNKNGSEVIPHAGQPYIGNFYEGLIYWDGINPPKFATEEQTSNLYINDSGILWANFLYKVVIKISYGTKNELDEFIEDSLSVKTYSRWLWTNSMYNNYYYNVQDFDRLPLELDLGIQYSIKSTSNYKLESKAYYNENMQDFDNDISLNSLGAEVIYVNQDKSQTGNINLSSQIGLRESYDTLYLSTDDIDSTFDCKIALGRKDILFSDIQQIAEDGYAKYNYLDPCIDQNLSQSDGIISSAGSVLQQLLGISSNLSQELWESNNAYTNYCSTFDLSFSSEFDQVDEDYIDPETNITYKYTKQLSVLPSVLNSDGIDLTLSGISFNKQCFQNYKEVTLNVPVVRSLSRTKQDWDKLNVAYDNVEKHFYFKQVLSLCLGSKNGDLSDIMYRTYSSLTNGTPDGNNLAFGGKNEYYYYNSPVLLDKLKILNVSTSIIPIFWSADEGDDGRLEEFHVENDAIISSDGVYPYGLPYSGKLLYYNTNDWTHGAYATVLQLALYKQDQYFYPLNDFIITAWQTYKGATQERYSSEKDGNSGGSTVVSPVFTMADYLVLVLSNIYKKTNEFGEYNGYQFSNLIYSQYNEIWKEHILFFISIKEDLEQYPIKFKNGASLSEYVDKVNSYCTVQNESSNENVKPNILPLTQIIDFQYQVPNTRTNIEQAYYEYSSEKTVNTLIYYSDQEDPVTSEMSFENSLYTMVLQDRKFVPLTGDLQYLFNSDLTVKNNLSVIITKQGQYPQIVTVKDVGKLINYDENSIFTVYNYPSSNLFNAWTSNDDSAARFMGISRNATLIGLTDYTSK